MARKISKQARRTFATPKPKNPDCEERFTVEEGAAVCRTALEFYHNRDNPLYLCILLDFQLGLRVSEMAGLKWGDIEGDMLTIQREVEVKYYVDPNGVVRRDGYQIVTYLKTHKEPRPVPLTASAKAVLDLIKSHYESHGRSSGPEDYIFQRMSGPEYNTPDAIHKVQRRSVSNTPDPSGTVGEDGTPVMLKHRSFHKIRKTWISTLLIYQPVTTVAGLAGHSDKRMTLNVYGKTLIPEAKVKKQMEEALLDYSEELRNISML